jgi:hypothetical protein
MPDGTLLCWHGFVWLMMGRKTTGFGMELSSRRYRVVRASVSKLRLWILPHLPFLRVLALDDQLSWHSPHILPPEPNLWEVEH